MSMDAIRDELAKLPEGSPLEMIGEYICHRAAADCSIAAGKTIHGAYSAMEDWARKHKQGSSCFVPPIQAVRLIDEYMGWALLQEAEYAQVLWAISMGAAEKPDEAPAPVNKPKTDDDWDLDALLEGD